ncbi:hypothetical protein HUJ04_008600 [Dendroctonus ponderosae]|uniref:Armadillo repeat-containing protein 1 n=1 Tax=Dendroctonus ponderosae TaxID=77166 RepID=A0AAR5PZF7_DENPD|nr:hypothetical protein HUJ04_008600 [Dendroctonus ponderosae]
MPTITHLSATGRGYCFFALFPRMRNAQRRLVSSPLLHKPRFHGSDCQKMLIKTAQDQRESLQKFLLLSSNQENHPELLADKKAILFAAATLTESPEVAVVDLCLEIVENFIKNPQAHAVLVGTFGVYEAMEALAIRMRSCNAGIARRAEKITQTLRNAAPPALSTRSRTKSGNIAKKQTVHLLHIPSLTLANRQKFEKSLLQIRGVISFLVDMEAKRCTLRLCPRVSIAEVVQKISSKCRLKCLVVRKNAADGAESLYDVVLNDANISSLEYPEEDFLQKSGALATLQAEACAKSGIFGSIKHFVAESFYW